MDCKNLDEEVNFDENNIKIEKSNPHPKYE